MVVRIKILVVFVVLALIAGTFSGCGSSSSAADSGSTSSASIPTSQTTSNTSNITSTATSSPNSSPSTPVRIAEAGVLFMQPVGWSQIASGSSSYVLIPQNEQENTAKVVFSDSPANIASICPWSEDQSLQQWIDCAIQKATSSGVSDIHMINGAWSSQVQVLEFSSSNGWKNLSAFIVGKEGNIAELDLSAIPTEYDKLRSQMVREVIPSLKSDGTH